MSNNWDLRQLQVETSGADEPRRRSQTPHPVDCDCACFRRGWQAYRNIQLQTRAEIEAKRRARRRRLKRLALHAAWLGVSVWTVAYWIVWAR